MMLAREMIKFIQERDGKLTDEEREMLSAMCRARIAQIEQVQAIGADLVPKLQAIVDEPSRPWRLREFSWPFALIAAALVVLMLAGCAGTSHQLTYVSTSDPVWKLNPTQALQ